MTLDAGGIGLDGIGLDGIGLDGIGLDGAELEETVDIELEALDGDELD